jgi:hypothetical protein
MSSKPNNEQKPEQEEEQSGGILLWLLLGILLVMLLGGGFAIASFLGLVSLDDLTNKARQLPRQIPIVAKYLPGESPVVQTDTEEAEVSAIPAGLPPQAAVETLAPLKPVVKPVASPETAEALAKAKAEEDKKISRVARLYSNMKPEEAAPIMKELDDDLVVTILKKMEDEQAAKILTAMEPQRAAKLTRVLTAKQKIIVQVN